MMLKKLMKLSYLRSSLLLLIVIYSCNNKYRGDTIVITAQYGKGILTPCELYSVKQPYSVIHLRKYENGNLIEYSGCKDEGFFTEDFTKENTYATEDLAVKNLSFECKGNNLTLIGQNYIIDRHVEDSIFTKPDSNDECIILIRKGI